MRVVGFLKVRLVSRAELGIQQFLISLTLAGSIFTICAIPAPDEQCMRGLVSIGFAVFAVLGLGLRCEYSEDISQFPN
jgi:hypothetical protein